MLQQFTLKKAEYYKARKQQFYFWLIFPPYFIALMWGIFYFTGTEFQKPSDLYPFLFSLLFILPMITFQSLRGISRAKTANKCYKVIFDDYAIEVEQLGSWNELTNQFLFFKPAYTTIRQRIPYREITAILKSKNGAFIIIGDATSYPKTIIISPDIENVKALEIAFSEIKRIDKYPYIAKNITEYQNKKIINKSNTQQLFDLEMIYPSLGIYVIFLLFSYFWFTPINWPLTAYLSMFFFLSVFGLLWGIIKNGHGISLVTIDETAIIVESQKNLPIAIPFNEITSIKKNAFNRLIIMGKKIDTVGINFVAIPNTLENFDDLEEKLNTIHPITYKNKKRLTI